MSGYHNILWFKVEKLDNDPDNLHHMSYIGGVDIDQPDNVYVCLEAFILPEIASLYVMIARETDSSILMYESYPFVLVSFVEEYCKKYEYRDYLMGCMDSIRNVSVEAIKFYREQNKNTELH